MRGLGSHLEELGNGEGGRGTVESVEGGGRFEGAVLGDDLRGLVLFVGWVEESLSYAIVENMGCRRSRRRG